MKLEKRHFIKSFFLTFKKWFFKIPGHIFRGVFRVRIQGGGYSAPPPWNSKINGFLNQTKACILYISFNDIKTTIGLLIYMRQDSVVTKAWTISKRRSPLIWENSHLAWNCTLKSVKFSSTVITRKLWNRKSTFKLKLWLLKVHWTCNTAIVQCKQTHFTYK